MYLITLLVFKKKICVGRSLLGSAQCKKDMFHRNTFTCEDMN